MTLSASLSSSVSALVFNTSRLGAVADNIANAGTPGYKATDVEGSTLVTRQTRTTAYAPGGVIGRPRPSVSVQGLLAASTQTTDIAISGQGFFPVQAPGGGATAYTRSGAFRPDAEGFLANADGRRLLALPTDASGVPQGTSPVPVDLEHLGGTAEATRRFSVGANLPSNDAAGTVRKVSVQVHDSLGNPLRLDLSFEKTGPNKVTLHVGDPTAPDGTTVGAAEEGSTGGGPYEIGLVFDGNGRISGIDGDLDGTVDADTPPTLAVSGLSTGAEDLRITPDLSGLSGFAGPFTIGHATADGGGYGSPAGISIGADGTITALFDNGEARPVYQIQLATFANPNGLEAGSGTLFRETTGSGSPLYGRPGGGGAGTLASGALEQSNVDIADQLVRSMLAGHAYKANLAAFETADEMERELLDTKA